MKNQYTALEGLVLPLEHLAEYDGAADYYARHGELPNLMGSPGAIDYINSDPGAFMQRVKECKYAIAMCKVAEDGAE